MRAATAVVGLVLVLLGAADSSAQSLFIATGDRAVEGAAGWSVGPFSQGVETSGAVSLDGRWDVGFGVNWYKADFGGASDTTLVEWTPFARYFLFKEEEDGSAVSLAVHGQFFKTDYGSEEGWYALAGGQLFKKLELNDDVALYPFVGFFVAGESYPAGGTAERALYLTRQFGVHGQITLGQDLWVRVSAEEHGLRRENFRAARVALVRRF